MEIQCDCGQFRAQVKNFPKQTPGRLGCYCDDCQSYMIYLDRTDFLDPSGLTEIVPVYPDNFEIISGASNLKCTRLAQHGLYRWWAGCCRTPLANANPRFPWVGVMTKLFNRKDAYEMQKIFGPVKNCIMGQYAKGATLPVTAKRFNYKSFLTVFPFILRGKLFKRYKTNAFFKEDGTVPIVVPEVLSAVDRQKLKDKFNQISHY